MTEAAATRGRTADRMIALATQRLDALPNPRLDAEALLRGVSGMSRAALLTQDDQALTDDVVMRLEAAIARRVNHEPIQYILGTAAFWRDEFQVTPAVLIPRPETELLVEAVATRLRPAKAPSLLDIGTGSGCIALSLLRELSDATALASDVSTDALAVAAANAARLDLATRIQFKKSDWFETLSSGDTFDAIVSNPPYVDRVDERTLPRDVREFEPPLALFADPDDDLSSYRAIIRGLPSHLRSGGLVGFEVGFGQAERVAALLNEAAFQGIEILNDLASIPRVVLAHRS